MVSTIPLVLVVMSVAVLTVPVYATRVVNGYAFVRVDQTRSHGPAVLYIDETCVWIIIDGDGVSYHRSWYVEEYYTRCRLEVLKCYCSDWGEFVIIICGSKVIAFGSGILVYGKPI